jgi:hypothetical protein
MGGNLRLQFLSGPPADYPAYAARVLLAARYKHGRQVTVYAATGWAGYASPQFRIDQPFRSVVAHNPDRDPAPSKPLHDPRTLIPLWLNTKVWGRWQRSGFLVV